MAIEDTETPLSVRLTKLPVYQQMKVEMPSLSQSLEVQIFPELECYDAMGLRLKAHVLAEEVDCRTTDVSFEVDYTVFASWWQHFKYSVFPRWLKKRYPPILEHRTKTRSKKVTFKRYATYPKASLVLPNEMGDKIVYRNKFYEEP